MRFNAALETFQHSIISGDTAIAAPLVREKTRMTKEEQIAIYSEGYRIRLRGAVKADYPCLAHYLGDAAIDVLIHAYVEVTPSRSYNLDFYPFGFWHYVQDHSADPAARDLAALEGAIAECFMTQGTAPLGADFFATVSEDELGATIFTLCQPCRLLRLAHDVETYLTAFKRDEADTSINETAIFLLIHRHDNEVRRRVLDEAEYVLLDKIHSGTAFDAAIEQTLATGLLDEESLATKISAWLPSWISEGFFAAA